MTRPAPLAALALAGALALGACGGDEQPEPTAERAGASLTVTETDFALDPPAARLPRAGAVRVAVVNRGRTTHALAIETPDGTRSTGTIEPGRSGTLSVRLPTGRHVWYCPVGDHRERGMRGTIAIGDEVPAPRPKPPAREAPSGGYGY